MFWRKKKKEIECDHFWHHIQDTYIPVDLGRWVETQKAVWIFCSKCKDKKIVFTPEWERIEKIQEILSHNSQD